jgi:antitoxin FitA
MANISIREVPEEVAQSLRRRAARNRRSLQRELILILEHAASEEQAPAALPAHAMLRPAGDATAPVRTIDDLLQGLRHKFGADVLTPSTSTAIIREMRDAREAGIATRAGDPPDRW